MHYFLLTLLLLFFLRIKLFLSFLVLIQHSVNYLLISYFRVLGKGIDQAKRYIVAFWNGVDLRYRILTNPKIRLNIAGIIIAMVNIHLFCSLFCMLHINTCLMLQVLLQDEGAIPYIQINRINSKLVDADRALHGMASYFYTEKRFPWKMYDMAMTTTK